MHERRRTEGAVSGRRLSSEGHGPLDDRARAAAAGSGELLRAIREDRKEKDFAT